MTSRARSSPAQAIALAVAGLAVVALAAQPRPTLPVRRAGNDSAAPTQGARALREGRAIDVNVASPAELMLLPRIGPRLAERIVEDRTRRGAFRTLDELARVPGIGRRTVEGLRGSACAGAPGRLHGGP